MVGYKRLYQSSHHRDSGLNRHVPCAETHKQGKLVLVVDFYSIAGGDGLYLFRIVIFLPYNYRSFGDVMLVRNL